MDEPMGSDDIANMDMGDDSDEEGDEMDTDDMDDEDDMDFGDEDDDEDTIDLTHEEDDEEVFKVFQLMGPDDNIVVVKDDEGNIHLKDDETGKEYMIVGESEEDEGGMFEEWNEGFEEGDDLGMFNVDEEIYEGDDDNESIEDIVGKMFNSNPEDEESEFSFSEFDEEEGMDGDSIVYEIEMDDKDEMFEYEIEMDDKDEMFEEDDNFRPKRPKMFESKKMSIAPKGGPKFKYGPNPNQGKGFDTKMKEGDKTMGTGKAKFEYKEGENAGSKLGTNKVVKKTETKEGSTRKPMVKKVETKEASRTLGAGSNFRKGGLPKPRAHSSFNTAIKESSSNKELQILREKNEEYRKALNVFRSKLNEVAVFNSNLAYATRLFTEHSTSKQEKINILRRFDGVETIKESKNLYQVVKNELSSGTKSQPMNESLERTIAKSPSTGAVNLLESKTYENPQFLRMKDLMAKIK
jgi:hypothetical protein